MLPQVLAQATTTIGHPLGFDPILPLTLLILRLTGGNVSLATITDFLSTAWFIFSLISFAISAIFIFGTIYAYNRSSQYLAYFNEKLRLEEKAWQDANKAVPRNERWQQVEEHIASGNPNDWKLAIIEADIMLDTALKQAGYSGSTIGENLKNASPRSLSTLDDAWQAHKVRNQIAHEGSDFILTHKLARDTITRYERVLNELLFLNA